MIRLAELLVFLAPLGAYLLYRRTVARGQTAPSRRMLAGIAVGLLLFGGVLSWFGVHERLPPDAHYVPARWENGNIVPGHAEPRG